MRVSAGGSGSKKQQPKKIDVANISAQKTEDGLNSALAKLAGRQGLGPKPKAAEQPPTQKAPTPPPAASAGNAPMKPPSKAKPTDKAQVVVGKGKKQPDLQQSQPQQKKPSASVASPVATSKSASYEEEKLWKEVDAAVSRMGPMADIEEDDRSDVGTGSAASRPSSSSSSSMGGFKQAPVLGGPRGFGAGSSSSSGGAVGGSGPRGFGAPAPSPEQDPALEGAGTRGGTTAEGKSSAPSAVPPQQQPPTQQQPQSRERRPPIRIMLFSMDEASTMEAIKVCGKVWDGVEKHGTHDTDTVVQQTRPAPSRP